MAFLIECDQCHRPAELAKLGRFCSDSCRNRHYRDALQAQRTRLAAEAEAAIRSGDIFALESIARRTAAFLKP